MSRHFTVLNEVIRHYRRFNAEGRELTVRMTAPPTDSVASRDIARYLAESVDELFEYALRNLQHGDMVGVSIHNADSLQDRPLGLSFRRRDQISREVLCSVLEKVKQSNADFEALDTLTFHVHSVRMPVVFGRTQTPLGSSLLAMARIKRSVVQIRAERDCLAHALVVAIARVTNDPEYRKYSDGRNKMKILSKVTELLRATGIDLDGGGGIPELQAFQRHLSQFRIVVYYDLRHNCIMFDGQTVSSQRINLLFDGEHYHVITKLTAALAVGYVCPACNEWCQTQV
jgi:predicted Zn-dependent protease